MPGYTQVRKRHHHNHHAGRTRNIKVRLQENRHLRRKHEYQPTVGFTLTNYTGTLAPEVESTIRVTQLRYRFKKGLAQLNICELETYYVRRYNRFPFFVKMVNCRLNDFINSSQLICKRRFEIGHVLRVENERHNCYPEGKNIRWVHDWETRVVGCDAILKANH